MTKNNDLIQASRNRDLEKIKELLADGTNVNAQGEYGVTALSEAVFHYNLRQGKVNVYENTEIVRALIEEGADLNIQDEYGNTPLHLASMRGYVEVVGLLVNKGAKTGIENNAGETPFDLAKSRGHQKVAEKLQKNNFVSHLKAVAMTGAVLISTGIVYKDFMEIDRGPAGNCNGAMDCLEKAVRAKKRAPLTRRKNL